MAYRKPSWRKLKPSDVLPLWTPAHSDAANLVFKSAMQKFGITDISSYWRKLRIPIVISVIVCACTGSNCEAKALGSNGKPLAGAAKAAFIKKCEADAKASK